MDGVFPFIFLVGLFFFIITQGALIYFAVRYRRRKGEEEAALPYLTLLLLAIVADICLVQGGVR